MSTVKELLSQMREQTQEEEELEASLAEESEIIVGRPHKDNWFRVHPDPEYIGSFYTVTYEKEIYLILDNEAKEHAKKRAESHVRRQNFYTTITHKHDLYIWPVPRPRLGESDNAWWQTGRQIANVAQQHWVRVWGGKNSYRYKKLTNESLIKEIGEPFFPEEDFLDLIERAFEGRIIASKDHEVIERL